MTNREKYAEQILDIATSGHSFAIYGNGEVSSCGKLPCTRCIFRKNKATDISCREKIKEWSEQECVEPPVDWSKVPVDTKVYVSDCDSAYWNYRYFARFEDGKIFTWANGTTSFTAKGFDDVTWWMKAKLAEEDA